MLLNVLLKGFFSIWKRMTVISTISTVSVHDSHTENKLFLGWNYGTKDAYELCSTRV